MGVSTDSEWFTFLVVAASAAVMIFLIRRLTRGMNQQDFILLRQTKTQGIDVSQPQQVDFIVFAASQETADELAQLMRDDGYETSISVAQIAYTRDKSKPGQAQDGWLVKGSRTLALTPENLKHNREFLNRIATERKSAYLGWQVGFAKNAAQAGG